MSSDMLCLCGKDIEPIKLYRQLYYKGFNISVPMQDACDGHTKDLARMIWRLYQAK